MNDANHQMNAVSTFPFYTLEGWNMNPPKLEDMLYKGNTVSYEYDSNGNLIYSRYYTSITTTETKLLSSEIKESFWEYDKNDEILHNKIIFRGEEKKYY